MLSVGRRYDLRYPDREVEVKRGGRVSSYAVFKCDEFEAAEDPIVLYVWRKIGHLVKRWLKVLAALIIFT